MTFNVFDFSTEGAWKDNPAIPEQHKAAMRKFFNDHVLEAGKPDLAVKDDAPCGYGHVTLLWVDEHDDGWIMFLGDDNGGGRSLCCMRLTKLLMDLGPAIESLYVPDVKPEGSSLN